MPSQLAKITGGFSTLLTGMGITMRNFFRPTVTVQYPRHSIPMTRAYRSAIEFVRFEESGTHDCIACDQCAKICPSDCIVLDGEKPEGVKRKRATSFDVDFALCSLCGLCIDVCPTDTLKYSTGFDEASFARGSLVHDLLTDFRDGEEAYLTQAREEQARKDAEKKAKAEAAAKAKAAKAAKEAQAAQAAESDSGDKPSGGEAPQSA